MDPVDITHEFLEKIMVEARDVLARTRSTIEKTMPHVKPEDVRTSDGKFLLMDAITAVVQAEAALLMYQLIRPHKEKT